MSERDAEHPREESARQLEAIGSWRRRERASCVQVFADGSWRTVLTITPAQEADTLEILRRVAAFLPRLRLRIASNQRARVDARAEPH